MYISIITQIVNSGHGYPWGDTEVNQAPSFPVPGSGSSSPSMDPGSPVQELIKLTDVPPGFRIDNCHCVLLYISAYLRVYNELNVKCINKFWKWPLYIMITIQGAKNI